MFSIYVRRICSIVMAVACVAGSAGLAAAAAPNVTFSASGVFANTPVSGNDLFQLAGQPFDISVVANVTTVPKSHGAQWAVYGPLKMTGTVQSRLLPTPIAISNNLTNIALAIGNPSYDVFQVGSPIQVVGMSIQISAVINMPKGTIQKACSAVGCTYIQPFTAPATLSPGNATLSYTNGTNVTVLAIQSGTVNAAFGGSLRATGVALYAGGAQSIRIHEDGTRTMRAIRNGPVTLGNASDVVALQFYGSGIRDASDIHVRIAGQEAPVLYAGASGHFTGLDQVSVQVPRSLAGGGDVDVVLTVDGQTAEPVQLQIE